MELPPGSVATNAAGWENAIEARVSRDGDRRRPGGGRGGRSRGPRRRPAEGPRPRGQRRERRLPHRRAGPRLVGQAPGAGAARRDDRPVLPAGRHPEPDLGRERALDAWAGLPRADLPLEREHLGGAEPRGHPPALRRLPAVRLRGRHGQPAPVLAALARRQRERGRRACTAPLPGAGRERRDDRRLAARARDLALVRRQGPRRLPPGLARRAPQRSRSTATARTWPATRWAAGARSCSRSSTPTGSPPRCPRRRRSPRACGRGSTSRAATTTRRAATRPATAARTTATRASSTPAACSRTSATSRGRSTTARPTSSCRCPGSRGRSSGWCSSATATATTSSRTRSTTARRSPTSGPRARSTCTGSRGPQNPSRVTYIRDMPFERATETIQSDEVPFSFSFDRAYWMSRLEPADPEAGVASFDGTVGGDPGAAVHRPARGGRARPRSGRRARS